MKVLSNEISINGNNLQEYIDSKIGKIGNLENLQTQKKDNLIDAINEIKTQQDTNKTNIGTLTNLTTDVKTNLVLAINDNHDKMIQNKNNISTLQTAQGTLTNLTTTDKTSLVKAINELKAQQDTNKTSIGTLTNLTTTDKTSLVKAINELKSQQDINKTNIGTLTNLTTTDKTSLVKAINEVNAKGLPSWIGAQGDYTANNTLVGKVSTINTSLTTLTTKVGTTQLPQGYTNITGAIAGLNTKITTNATNIGNLSTLQLGNTATTQNKSSLVNVANYLYSQHVTINEKLTALENSYKSIQWIGNNSQNWYSTTNTLINVLGMKFANGKITSVQDNQKQLQQTTLFEQVYQDNQTIQNVSKIVKYDELEAIQTKFEELFGYKELFTQNTTTIIFDQIKDKFINNLLNRTNNYQNVLPLVQLMTRDQIYDASFQLTVSEEPKHIGLYYVFTSDNIFKICFEYSSLIADEPLYSLSYKLYNNQEKSLQSTYSGNNYLGKDYTNNIKQYQIILDQQKDQVNKLQYINSVIMCIFNDQQFYNQLYNSNGRVNQNYFFKKNLGLLNYLLTIQFVIDCFDVTDFNKQFNKTTLKYYDQYNGIIMNLNTKEGTNILFMCKNVILLNCNIDFSANQATITNPWSNDNQSKVIIGLINCTFKCNFHSQETIQCNNLIINSYIQFNNIRIGQFVDFYKCNCCYNSNINQLYYNQDETNNIIIDNNFQSSTLIYKTNWNVLNINVNGSNYWYPCKKYSDTYSNIGQVCAFRLSTYKKKIYIINSQINNFTKPPTDTTADKDYFNNIIHIIFGFSNITISNEITQAQPSGQTFTYITGKIAQNNKKIILKDNEFTNMIVNYNEQAITFNTIYNNLDTKLYETIVGGNGQLSVNTFINN